MRSGHWASGWVLIAGLFAVTPAIARPAAAEAEIPEPADPGSEPESEPWRISAALSAPEWLRFGLDHRSRFEHLENDFRLGATGDARALLLQTLLRAELATQPVIVGAELQDSRAYGLDGISLNTTHVNAFELLQAYVGLRLTDKDDRVSLTLGRFTLNVGSRRLVARTGFGNTMSSFTGVDFQWSRGAGAGVRAFAAMPVLPLPTRPTELSENEVELDRENTQALFWGIFFGSGVLASRTELELYWFGLHERDGQIVDSSNRRIFTPGARLFRAPAPGVFDFQLEPMLQFGVSRATAAEGDESDLDHFAFSVHATLGYRFDVAWAPRVVVQYDIASGDRNPDDGDNERFDPLFGDRRFEFGPTGIYGAFARRNIHSPGVRLELEPEHRLSFFAAYRPFWLASARDAWVPSGLSDPSGASGSFVGHQIEASFRWQVAPGNFNLEIGAAHLIVGEFAERAPGAPGEPTTHLYTQVSGSI